jgi:PAS domain S-box-containing protein
VTTRITNDKEVNCRVTNSILKYLESMGFGADSVIAGLPYSKEYLSNPGNWVTYETRETLCRRAAELTNDDSVMFKVGLSIPKLNPLGGVEPIIRNLTGPRMVYKFVPRYSSLLDKAFKFKAVVTGKNTATIEMKLENPGYRPSKSSCYFTQGILAAVPTLWGLPAAAIREKKCMCKQPPGIEKEDVEYGAEACLFEVEWQPLGSWFQRQYDNFLGRIIPLSSNIRELEQNLHTIDQKNTELVARNRQLAAVREIAISVDKVKTIDEALRLIVEQAREITGIRFVIVQKMDESQEFVITPYYSKIRNSVAVNAMKALGFDPSLELGENPTSKKLRFPLSKLKVAQDYLRNPRVIVMSSLADLLDGIWPRTLCNSIQQILKVKKLVIVPIMIEGSSWGNMLYFLTEEVPIDILEMISSHCAIALMNIMNLNNLELRNQELSNTQQKLKESEERYRTIFESANDILLLIDNKGKIIDVNGRVEDLGGYPREEILGNDFRGLSRIMTRKSLLILTKNYLKRMAGMNVPYYDVEMIKKNGEHITMQISAVAVRKDGQVYGDLAILRDVTELKAAEKNIKLQRDLIDRVLATIPNAVILLNKNLQIIMANQTFYNLFKLKKHTVKNKHLGELIVAPELDGVIEKLLDSKEKNAVTEFRYSIESVEKYLLSNAFVMEDGNLLLVINDISEERERQERLYLTDRLASVGEMASGVAHELNNPLTSIIGLSGLIMEQDTLENISNIKQDLAAINSEAQRCAKIVRNLLTFARKHGPKRQYVNVANIVEDVIKLRAYEHKANSISIETAFPSGLPDIFVDYFQIQQVFLNIILNAETAMVDANGHGTLKITAESAGGSVRVSFSDDGPGISKENLRVIFNPFFTTKEVGKGTGLGLSICYGIITSHEGKIYARSEYGHGATFIVELPVKANS